MKAEETIKMLSDKDFLDKLYGYAYKRCSTSHDAEDLCSDIVVSILHSVNRGKSVDNFYAFAWTVAHRVYADYCEKRKVNSDAIIDTEYSDNILTFGTNQIEDFLDSELEKEQLSQIFTEISFLAKIYRDVMVMYYLDELKISVIAKKT